MNSPPTRPRAPSVPAAPPASWCEATSPSRKSRFSAALLGVHILVCVSAALSVALTGCQEQPASAPTSEVQRSVKVATVSFLPADSFGSLVGEVEPQIVSNLGFRIGGKIVERLSSVGDIVTAGTVLARLDAAQAQNTLNQAQANVAAASAQKNNAEQTEQRQRELLAQGFTTQAAFDAATAQANVARANLATAEAALSDARDGVTYTTLIADEPGVIMAVGAEIGQVVAAGQMVMQLARTDLRDGVFLVPETGVRAHPLGTPVRLSLLDNPSVVATGKVRQISPVADPTTRTFRVKVGIDNPQADFRYGSPIRGLVDQTGPKIAKLPLSALFQENDQPGVWLVDSSGAVKLARVAIASYGSADFSVSEGLADGDHVVVAGVQRLRPGMKVSLDGASEP